MKIGILSNIASPATDIYRSIHPFKQLGYDTAIIDPDKDRWYELYSCDVLVVSRPNGAKIESILHEFKKMGTCKKIIIDMDDNLHEVSKSNPAHNHFTIQPVKDTVIRSLSIADHVIYSTQALYDYYDRYNTSFIPSTVIPNAVDLRLTPIQEPKPLHTPVRVLWRGSEHHKRDLETIRTFWNWILSEENKGRYEVMMMGLQSHDVYSYFPNAISSPWNPSPFAYWSKIAELGADVAVFPLEQTVFNQGKSNIFALEMIVNGVIPFVPMGFPEFQHPGVAMYEDLTPDNFEAVVYATNRIELIKAGQQWIRENRTLEIVNEKRRKIIEEL